LLLFPRRGNLFPAPHFDDGNSLVGRTFNYSSPTIPLEGRDTGSEGLRKAQAYAVEQLQKAGLEPAGVNGSSTSPSVSINTK